MSAQPPGTTEPLAPTSSRLDDGRVLLWATVALVVGGIAIGISEFAAMGLLPQMGASVGVDIPTAGHAISAYAIGVVIGAPAAALLGARAPRKTLALGLMALFLLGNALTAVAGSYEVLLGARFLSGLPHGGFFGLSALIVSSLAKPGQQGRAVGQVMLGIPLANMLGVPAATWLGQTTSWRGAYWLVAALAALTLVLVVLLVPFVAGDRTARARQELSALARPQFWLAMGVGAVGFGGMFAMYSYIAPTVTDVTGQPESMVPWFLVVYGLGGVLGTVIGGRLADWSVLRGITVSLVAAGALLAIFTGAASSLVPALIVLALISASATALVVNLQVRLMRVAGPARTLGAAANHVSLNVANALGAWLGGLVVAAGFGYPAASWVGAGLSIGGLLVLGVSVLLQRRENIAAGRGSGLRRSPRARDAVEV